MAFSQTTSLARPSARANVSPKTHVPGSRLQERGHRYHSPRLGRWISRDPIEELGFRKGSRLGAEKSKKGGDAHRQELYVFCVNSAQNGIDALGLNAVDAARKLLTGRLPKMWSVDLSLASVAVVGTTWAAEAGFFGDTCELGFFLVGPAALNPNLPANSNLAAVFATGLPIGLNIGVSANVSIASWRGSGLGAASTWAGLFYGGQASVGPVGVGVFWDPQGNWIGASAGVGASFPGGTANTNPQYFWLVYSVTIPRPLCYCTIAALP